jgi:hypothetical protein
MPQHVIQFNARTSWEGRSNGLPEMLHSFLLFDQFDRDVFDRVIDEFLSKSLSRQAFVCDKNQDQIIDIRQFPADKMLVPMHWIAAVTVSVYPLVGEMPQADEEGVQRLANGEEPIRQ